MTNVTEKDFFAKEAKQLHCFYDHTQSLSDDLFRFCCRWHVLFVRAEKLKLHSKKRHWMKAHAGGKDGKTNRSAEKGESCD